MDSHNLDDADPSRRWQQKDPEAGAVAGTALLGKAFGLLDIIAAAPGLITVKELIARSGWPRATLYRILAALTQQGYVRFDPVQEGYTLGYRLVELAQNVWAGPDLASVASVELRRLRDMTGETAYLAVLHGGLMISLGKFESAHAHRSAARLGVSKPLHCTSQGKAMLAFLPERQREHLLAGVTFEAFTPHTILQRDALVAQLGIIKNRGYAVEDQEILIGNRCVGAPILDSSGYPVAAISVAGPTYRLTSARVEQLGPEVATVARHISLQLKPRMPGAAHAAGGPAVLDGQDEPAHYGMSPIWDGNRHALTWIDALGPRIIEWTGQRSASRSPEYSGPLRGLFLSPEGAPVVWAEDRRFTIRHGKLMSETSLPAWSSVHAATYGDGQVWLAERHEAGTTIGLLTDGGITPIASLKAEIGTLAWSDSEACLFASDHAKGTLYRMTPAGEVRLFSRIARVSGEPRGLAVDPRGHVWVALYDGWGVMRLSREGEIDTTLALPVPRPTGLAFGGAERRTLFITTARYGLSMDALAHAPDSGMVFRHDLPTP